MFYLSVYFYALLTRGFLVSLYAHIGTPGKYEVGGDFSKGCELYMPLHIMYLYCDRNSTRVIILFLPFFILCDVLIDFVLGSNGFKLF